MRRIIGVKSLIKLNVLDLVYKPTADMEADALTKYIGAKTLARQRKLVGCILLPHGASE